MKDETICELCGRSPIETTEHHLVPREFGGAEGDTAQLCIPCHKQVHAWFTNEEGRSGPVDIRAGPVDKSAQRPPAQHHTQTQKKSHPAFLQDSSNVHELSIRNSRLINTIWIEWIR